MMNERKIKKKYILNFINILKNFNEDKINKIDANFVSTQFITFNSSLESKEIYLLLKPLENMGFEIISKENIREIKKIYFREYTKKFFIELKNDEFGGVISLEVEEIKTFKKFLKIIITISKNKSIEDLTIMLTLIAEINKTENLEVVLNENNIEEIAKLMLFYPCYNHKKSNLIIYLKN